MEYSKPRGRAPAWPFVVMLGLGLAALLVGFGKLGALSDADRSAGLMLFVGGASVVGCALATLVLGAARRGTLFERDPARVARNRSSFAGLALGGVGFILFKTVGSEALGELLLLGCAGGGLLGLGLALLWALRARAAG